MKFQDYKIMARITKKEYEYGRFICEKYEKQEAEIAELKETAKEKFPVGCHVCSKLHNQVKGQVYGYGEWNGIPQLLITSFNGGLNRILATNAIKL